MLAHFLSRYLINRSFRSVANTKGLLTYVLLVRFYGYVRGGDVDCHVRMVQERESRRRPGPNGRSE